MDYDAIFAAYYKLYRLEADTPASTDDEYVIGIGLANEAINRWANYDDTYWKELFTTLQDSTQNSPTLVKTITSGTSTYTAPTDYKEAGGYVRLLNADGTTFRRYAIINPSEVQFKQDDAQYAYFSGNPSAGYTLNLNPAPTSEANGKGIQYDYYKKPALVSAGTDVVEMPQPYFVVHRMLANRFRGSRNPYYSSAKADAEDILRTMQLDNNSGSWANPWTLTDNSGTVWGGSAGNTFFGG